MVLAWFLYYRIGKQSVIDDLIKAYKEVCKDNDGGRLGTDVCPTLTINSWQQNVFLIEEYE